MFKTEYSNISWRLTPPEWVWLIVGSLFSFLFASILLSGWPAGLVPNLSAPFVYSGDGQSSAWIIQRLLEGWVFDNPRSGYPFGSSFLDYPSSDAGNFFILKLFGIFTGSYYGAMNLYLLVGFPVVFITSFLVLKNFSLTAVYAFTGSLLFTFASFHLFRLIGGHIFYTWYFVVPIYFFYGWKIFLNGTPISHLYSIKKIISLFIVLIILSSFGVYFALFGILIFLTCGVAASLKQKGIKGLAWSVILSLIIAFGVGLNVLPNLIYKYKNGPNPEVANRIPAESELFGLKIVHLLLPLNFHRIEQLRKPMEQYSRNFGATEATYSSSLGILGSIGFFILIYSIFYSLLGKRIDDRLGFLSILVFMILLVSIVGGLSVLFAMYISPMIRGWNRISIFISFATFIALMLVLQDSKKIKLLYKKNKLLCDSVPLGLLIFGLFDQTSSSYISWAKNSALNFNIDKQFISEIENQVPPGSAIYQLPYMSFPESPVKVNLGSYESLGGYINSKTLKWSHGGIQGREGDIFYRYLSKESIAKQLDVIKRLGFAGLYIDRRGFSDNGEDIIKEINKFLGMQPSLIRKDNQVVFYRIQSSFHPVLHGLTVKEIMAKAEYFVSKDGPSYQASAEEGMNFSRQGLPSFVENVIGLSGVESWGRWSDANITPSVRVNLVNPLPDTFDLILSLVAFGPNAGKQLKLVLGTNIFYITLDGFMDNLRLPIHLKGEKVTSIEFIPPVPISPPGDLRRLAVGFVNLKIKNNFPGK